VLLWSFWLRKYSDTEGIIPLGGIFMIPYVLEGGVVAAAEVTIVKTPLIGPNLMFTSLSVLAMDDDNIIATFIEIGIINGTKLIPIDSTPGPFPANTSMTIYWPCMLGAGQGIYAKFSTPTDGDRLTVISHGILEKAVAYDFRASRMGP
jgi:hypothetical protein